MESHIFDFRMIVVVIFPVLDLACVVPKFGNAAGGAVLTLDELEKALKKRKAKRK